MPGDRDGARRRGHRAVGGRRPRVVHDGAEPRGRRRAFGRPRRHHVLLAGRLRRRRRMRRRRAGRDGDRDRPVQRRGGVAGAQARRPDVAPVGAGRRRASPTPGSGLGRSASSARSTRSRCSTRRYMHEYGGTRDHLANIALAFRKHAARNPASTMGHKPLTRDDYMNARWISEPLCLFDNCLETDGALAVVLVSAERARDLPATAGVRSRVRARAAAAAPDDDELLHRRPAARPRVDRGAVVVGRADVGPADVKVAQLYDAFSPLIILSLEGYGFCERGEGGPFTDDGAIELGGRLPVNTSGGGMSRGLRPRLQSHSRRRAPDPRHVDRAGRERRRVARDVRRRRTDVAPSCSRRTR